MKRPSDGIFIKADGKRCPPDKAEVCVEDYFFAVSNSVMML